MNNNQTKGFVMPTTTTSGNFVFGGKTTFPTTFQTQSTFPTTFGQTTQTQSTFPTTFQAQTTFPTTFGQPTQTQSTFPTTFGQPTQSTQPQTTFGQPTQQQIQSTFPTIFTQTQTKSTFPTTFGQPTQPQPQDQTQTTFSQATQDQTQPQTFVHVESKAETKSTQFPTTKQCEIEDYLFSARYNKDAIFKSDHSIHINTGLKIFTFQFDSKIKNNMYKLKEKDTGIEIVIRFENKSPEFTEEEIHRLKIRPVGKSLLNHYKNKYENCSFIEPCDGTIYKYFTKIKELIGQREFGSLKLDIPKIFQIVEQLRKNMLSLFELNNQFVYTNLTLDNIVYRCKNNNLNETEFKLLLDNNVYPIDGVNKYITTFPPYEMKTGIIVLDTKEKKEQTLSWYIGILLIMFLGRHIPEFNSLNWIINDVSLTDLNKLKLVMFSFYGEKYSNYLSNIPSERPSIYASIDETL